MGKLIRMSESGLHNYIRLVINEINTKYLKSQQGRPYDKKWSIGAKQFDKTQSVNAKYDAMGNESRWCEYPEDLIDDNDDIESFELRDKIEALLNGKESPSHLKERESYILRHYYGIGCNPEELEEIGEEIGLTPERVRQVREKALNKIRDSIKSGEIDLSESKNMRNVITLNEQSLKRLIREALNEIGDTYRPIKNNKTEYTEREGNDGLTKSQKEYAFKRHCENLAKQQGRDNLAKSFDMYAADQWNNDYGFENHDGKPGEVEDYWMDYDRPYPMFSYKYGDKHLSNIGHRAGLRKKLDNGYRSREVAPRYDENDGEEKFYDGWGNYYSDRERERGGY